MPNPSIFTFKQPFARHMTGWVTRLGQTYCPVHSHQTLEIVFHAHGDGRSDAADTGLINYQAGSVTVYPPGVSHDQTTAGDGEDCCIHLDVEPEAITHIPQTIHIDRLADNYAKRELRALASARSTHSEFDRISLNHRVAALLARLLAIHYDSETPVSADASHRYAERAFEYIVNKFQNIGGLQEVADHAGVSQDYLRHVFRERYSKSLKSHLTQCRIEHAKRLLLYSTLPAKEISIQCGFSNPRHFSASFREHIGQPPVTYRRLHQQS